MPPTAAAEIPRHNFFSDEDFVRLEPARGTVRDATGRRLVRVSADVFDSWQAALAHEGVNAGAILYKVGRKWGDAEFRSFAERAPREFGVASLDEMHFQVMLESWRWPLTAAGWGTWRYDFRRARVGLPVVELANSATVTMSPVGGSPPVGDSPPVIDRGLNRQRCHLYAGLFAAVFSGLAKRDLVGVELQCAATGADCCRFLVASAARIETATRLRDEGLAAEEILDRMAAPPAATKPQPTGDHGQ